MDEDIFFKLNEFYKSNPPNEVLDDDGVRHQIEMPLPSDYEYSPCDCGKIHQTEDQTWWHAPLKLNEEGRIGIYRCCKTCMNMLMKTRKKDE